MSNQSKGIQTSGLKNTKVVGKKGEWTKVSGVDLKNGVSEIKVNASGSGIIKICAGSPTGDVIGYANPATGETAVVNDMSGTKDIYFVFSGDVEFDSWSFS